DKTIYPQQIAFAYDPAIDPDIKVEIVRQERERRARLRILHAQTDEEIGYAKIDVKRLRNGRLRIWNPYFAHDALKVRGQRLMRRAIALLGANGLIDSWKS